MKKRFYIKAALLSLSTMMLLSSCLKDDGRYIDFKDSTPVVDFPIIPLGTPAGSFQTATLSAAATTNTVNFLVNIQSAKPTTVPVTITCIVDAAALTAYNTANGKSYTLLPSTAYTGNLSVTIPPGVNLPVSTQTQPIVGAPVTAPQGQADMPFVINTAAASGLPSGSYVLPLTITSVTGLTAIIDQYHTLMYLIVIK